MMREQFSFSQFRQSQLRYIMRKVRFEAFIPGINKWQPVGGGSQPMNPQGIPGSMKNLMRGRVERVRAIDCETGAIIDMC